MNKLPDDNLDNLNDGKPGEAQHLSDDLLLLSVDGELSGRDAAQVSEHLEACWSCRARRDRIEESIADVVDYRNCILKPYLPASKTGRGLFVASLNQYAEEIGRPSLFSRFIGVFRAAMVPPRRAAWISMLLALGLCVFVLIKLRSLPSVSASDLLVKARTSEVDATRTVAKPVVYQKLRIRSKGYSLTRTIYRDPIGHRVSSSDQMNQAANLGPGSQQATDRMELEKELQQAFQSARLDWSDPLSAAAFSAWRDGLSQRNDTVSRDGRDFLLLRTTTAAGPIIEGDLTVRAKDFHAVAESLVLRDEQRIEISELAYEVLNLDEVDLVVFSSAPVLAPPLRSSESVSAVPLQPSESNLAGSELQARVALHAAGADLGEKVEVSRTSRAPVLVRGLTSTPERKQELLAALKGIPDLDVRLQTVDEAVAQRPSEEIMPPNREVLVTGHPALEDILTQRFPNPDDRAAFVNRGLALVDLGMAHAWALRHLEERYAPDQVALLNQSGRQTLELLIRDHVATIREELAKAEQLVDPLLVSSQAESGTPADSSAQEGWRKSMQEMFESVQRIQQAVTGLLAGSSATQNEPEVLSRDFQLNLRRLKAQVSLLSGQVSGPFLSNPTNGAVPRQDEIEKQEKP